MNNNDFLEDIDIENLKTDETDDDTISNLLRCIGEQAEIENNRNAVLDPKRAEELIKAYRILTHITKGTSAKVTCTMNEPYVSMGVVSVEGIDLTFRNPNMFRAVAGLASNFNVYPKTNGIVHMDFTFHNLTIPI